MPNIIDGRSGKKKFFKGRGRKGKTELDDYQKMLEDKSSRGKKQKPPKNYKPPKTLNQLVRWK